MSLSNRYPPVSGKKDLSRTEPIQTFSHFRQMRTRLLLWAGPWSAWLVDWCDHDVLLRIIANVWPALQISVNSDFAHRIKILKPSTRMLNSDKISSFRNLSPEIGNVKYRDGTFGAVCPSAESTPWNCNWTAFLKLAPKQSVYAMQCRDASFLNEGSLTCAWQVSLLWQLHSRFFVHHLQ